MKNNLEYYRIFYTVAKLENISDAAKELFISQPAVSKCLKKLESSIGMPLFYRGSRGVKLTSDGKLLFDYVEKALESLDEGEKVLDKLKSRDMGSVKIGISTTLCKYFLIPRLKGFIDLFPNLKIIIINKSANETLNLIASGEIDIGLVSFTGNSKNFNFKSLSNIQDIFVATPNFLNNKLINSLDDLKKCSSLIFLEKHNISRVYLDSFLRENFIELSPTMEVNNMDLLIELTKLNLGVASTAREFVGKELEEKTLIELKINPSIPKRNINIVCNNNLPLSLAAKSFWDYLCQN